MSHEARFNELVESATQVSIEALHQLFDSLEAVDTSFMLGEWEGGVFKTGHKGERQLDVIKWAGKSFLHENDVDPIISRAAAIPTSAAGNARSRLSVRSWRTSPASASCPRRRWPSTPP